MNFSEWTNSLFELITPDLVQSTGSALLRVFIVIVGTKLILRFIFPLVDRIFAPVRERQLVQAQRYNTLRALMRSLMSYTAYVVAILTLLPIFGVPTASVIATAGVLGLAVGFGAQNFVKDVISGFFILFDDQFAVGDYVEVSGASGIVEEVGLRVTKVREFNGGLHFIPNGSIEKVVNYSRGSSRAWVDISVAYEEDVERVIKVLEDLMETLGREEADIVDGPKVLGVTSLADSGVVISILAMTKPMEKWRIERGIRQRIKEAFDHLGIEIPYPKRVLLKTERDPDRGDPGRGKTGGWDTEIGDSSGADSGIGDSSRRDSLGMDPDGGDTEPEPKKV
ncbi:MAG: mechanosensitive ion channel family protein [Firmicutes bacterium]|nr:mechanosensitive ion channel family protein [Bacillota bacterium]